MKTDSRKVHLFILNTEKLRKFGLRRFSVKSYENKIWRTFTLNAFSCILVNFAFLKKKIVFKTRFWRSKNHLSRFFNIQLCYCSWTLKSQSLSSGCRYYYGCLPFRNFNRTICFSNSQLWKILRQLLSINRNSVEFNFRIDIKSVVI